FWVGLNCRVAAAPYPPHKNHQTPAGLRNPATRPKIHKIPSYTGNTERRSSSPPAPTLIKNVRTAAHIGIGTLRVH
ncbi:hypothetical protein, partial [Enterobacter sichuanensis]